MSGTPRTDALEKNERHNNVAETRYWLEQYKRLCRELEHERNEARGLLAGASMVLCRHQTEGSYNNEDVIEIYEKIERYLLKKKSPPKGTD